MEVRNCRGCGKLYNYIGGPYRNLCPNCIEKIEEKYLDAYGITYRITILQPLSLLHYGDPVCIP